MGEFSLDFNSNCLYMQSMARILVVDDNALESSALRDLLSQEGYDVAVAADATEGYAAAIDIPPDLILLDVQLPDVNGTDLIRIIKNREDLKDIPIIMITGKAKRAEDKARGLQAGADDYLLKPFETSVLMQRIQWHLKNMP